MDQSDNPHHWRQMFDAARRSAQPGQGGTPSGHGAAPPPQGGRPFGYDDGYDPAREADAARQQSALSPEEITDEAAMALGADATEYKPWILQRGQRPVMMLHLRRYEPKSGLWMGWQVAYSHLIAVEYTGDTLLSLDFGSRQFVIEGKGLDELARHLQSGNVLVLQEWTKEVWISHDNNNIVNYINYLQFK